MLNRRRISRKDFIRLLGYGGVSVMLGLLLNSAGLPERKKLFPHVGSTQNLTAYDYKDSYSYLIEKQGSIVRAKNGKTGSILISDSNATIVIQAAMNNLTHDRISPELVKIKGDYALGNIKIPSYTTLDCREAKLSLSNNINDHFLVNSDAINGNTQINIIDGIIDGNKTNNDQGSNIIHFEKVTNSLVQNTYIDNAAGHGIQLRACTNLRLVLPTVKNSRKEGVSMIDGGQNSCLGGYFYNTGWSFISTLNTHDALIQGNYGDTTGNETSGITPNGLRNIVVDNILTNTAGSAIPIAQINTSAYNASGSIISRNILWKPLNNGITCVNYPVSDIIIANNLIVGGDAPRANITAQGICFGAGIEGFKNIIIQGNIVHDFQSSGIRASVTSPGSISSMKIVNNVVSNNGKALGSANIHRYGIVLAGSSAHPSLLRYIGLKNNTVYDTSIEQGQNYGVYFRWTTDCAIEDNDLIGNVVDGILNQNNTALKIRNNDGYKTENSGTATVRSGKSTVLVNHGLSSTPSINDIKVTPTNDMGLATKFWISTVTPRRFTITVDQNPGQKTATFVWQII